ncbi:hypothetical protein [Bifidobacterium sp. ESL0819]|uniref:hypothetical protein n=1 Tax=Bifidobacterium sp. ESL0819 TaxID=3448589 RepID=UPI004041F0A8
MSRNAAQDSPVIFELLDKEQARGRTPYGKDVFEERFGHLYREPKPGKNGGFLATDLQAEVETWPFRADRKKREQAS